MKRFYLIVFGVLVATFQCISQNTIQFTGINITPLNTVQLHWASNTNEYYEVDYANALSTNADGTTAWQTLYDDYPSQGTNTFWCDGGNFSFAPPVPTPASQPMRFYRIRVEGTNDGGDNLSVTINSLTNGETLSGNVTVSVGTSTEQEISDLRFYVDGQETSLSPDGTNFTFNTCNWWNGQHVLFVAAKSASGMDGNMYDSSVVYNRAVSPMVTVDFKNLINEVQLSQQFFQPSLGQTQQVKAQFAENSDWTLQIQDINDNTVLVTNGSGMSMSFAWDGAGQGGTNIPDGVYSYVISAETNGLDDTSESEAGPSDSGSGAPLPDFMTRSQLFAVNTNVSDDVLPLAIIPPGMVADGYTVFSATSAQVQSLYSDSVVRSPLHSIGRRFSPDDSGSGSSAPSSQSTTNSGPKNALGTFGVAYQTYPDPTIKATTPLSGNPLHPHVAVDGNPENDRGLSLTPPRSLNNKAVADNFVSQLQSYGYFGSFVLANDQVTPALLEKASLGGSSIFNNVNVGFLMLHGSFGTTAESDSVKYTYVYVESIQGRNIVDLRLSDMTFGGSTPTNGLRFMTLGTCFNLQHTDFNSMSSTGRFPMTGNLHVLNGCSTVFLAGASIGYNYGLNLTYLQDTVINAWYNAGTTSYNANPKGITNNITYASTYWPACQNDTISTFSTPDPADGLQYSSRQVYTVP